MSNVSMPLTNARALRSCLGFLLQLWLENRWLVRPVFRLGVEVRITAKLGSPLEIREQAPETDLFSLIGEQGSMFAREPDIIDQINFLVPSPAFRSIVPRPADPSVECGPGNLELFGELPNRVATLIRRQKSRLEESLEGKIRENLFNRP